MAARTATLSGTVSWSNGTLFDGYVLLALVLPAGHASAAACGTWPHAQAPLFTKVPISSGAFNQAVFVYWNADLEPPNCRYGAYWYDAQDTLISGPSAIFDIAASPYPIALPTLTAPAAGTVVPAVPASPDSVSVSAPAAPFIDETPAGLVNGSNTAYTLTAAPRILLLMRNGLPLTGGGVDFVLSGLGLTFVTAPGSGDLLRAIYWT